MKHLTTLGAIAALVIFTGLFFSCRPKQLSGNLTITDHYNREVSITRNPLRIVSLAPAITETLFAMGYGERIVGRSDYCNYPPEAYNIEVAGTLMELNMENIVLMKPDLIIAGTHFPKENVQALENSGYQVVVLMGQGRFEGTYEGVIRPIGRILDDPEAAEELIESMEQIRLTAMERVKKFPYSPTVYYVVGFGEGGDWTAGGDTFIGQMLSMAGSVNIAQDLSGWAYNLESLVEKDPDIIIVPEWALESFPKTPVYSDLSASRNGRIFSIDEDLISRQGPRLTEGLVSLVDIIEQSF